VLTKLEIDKPSTGEPIKSHSPEAAILTNLLYVIFPDVDPEILIAENSPLLEFIVTVPEFEKFPPTVNVPVFSIVSEDPLSMVRFWENPKVTEIKNKYVIFFIILFI
jgi:hypothetical protein